MGPVGMIRIAIAVLAVAGCGNDIERDREASAEEAYPDIAKVFDHAVAQTCSLNNGVCHNSNSYPDLHSVTTFVDTVDRPCNVDAPTREQVHDVCEVAADRLVIPGKSAEARIVSAWLPPSDMELETRSLTRVHLRLASTMTAVAPGDTVEVHRDGTVFQVAARVVSVSGLEVVLDIATGERSTQEFFDARVFPPGPLRLHVGDTNGNGIEGARTTPMPLVAVGDPHGSYLFKRLVDSEFGELMPRQCRTWSDQANRAIGCWIAGLRVDDAGAITNAYDPIDYASCDIEVTTGKCLDGVEQ